MNRQALRELAEALPIGAALAVPREWLLDLLGSGEERGTVPPTGSPPPPDLTVGALAKRFDRAPATVREWCERQVFAGAYRFRGREWRVPLASVLAFEAEEREKGAPPGKPRARRTRGTSLQRLHSRRRTA